MCRALFNATHSCRNLSITLIERPYLSDTFSFLLPKHKVPQLSPTLVIAARASHGVPSTLQTATLLSVDPEFFQFLQCSQDFSSC
jgi:hypothetical protein